MTLIDSTAALPDVQRRGDSRSVTLDEVGIAGLSLPVSVIVARGEAQATIADAEFTVEVPSDVRGTHMSRFVEAVQDLAALSPAAVSEFARDLLRRLDAERSCARFEFPLFLQRTAPVSGLSSLLKYDAWLFATATPARSVVEVGVQVPVTSLCPCSREISDYGAHSQRGYVRLSAECASSTDESALWPRDLFEYASAAGSAPIYPLLKRVDERAVTMQAYDTPAFVEDIARDAAVALRSDDRCSAWTIEVTNHESIHAHQAVARLSGRR